MIKAFFAMPTKPTFEDRPPFSVFGDLPHQATIQPLM